MSFTLKALKMEDLHREILRKNHSLLVREMTPELVAEQLYSDYILTLEMKENVLTQLTTFAKSRKLLDYLPKRGKKAFSLFCLALEKSNQLHLARQLRQGQWERNDETASPSNMQSQNGKPASKTYTQLCQLHLGDEIYVTGNVCENVVQIHIRQYDRGNTGPYPTKKGVTMSLSEWLLLESFVTGMEEAVLNYRELKAEHIWFVGNNIRATASKEYPLIDLRHYWQPDPNGDLKPTTKGVKLNRRKLENLKNIINIIRDFIPQLKEQDAAYSILPTQFDLQSLEGLLNIPSGN
jgi:hypothetical protein